MSPPAFKKALLLGTNPTSATSTRIQTKILKELMDLRLVITPEKAQCPFAFNR